MMEENKGNKINGMPMVLYWKKMPYELKVRHAENLVHDFYNNPEVDGRCYISVGGLDSIVLTLFIRSLGYTQEQIPAMSVSSLEHPGNQKVHKAIGVGVIPRGRDKNGEVWTLPKVYRECGYPILSKPKAQYINAFLSEGDKYKVQRERFIMVNEGKREGMINCRVSKKHYTKIRDHKPDFKISDKCCEYMKERPCREWAKKDERYPFLGLMVEESGRRAKSLEKNGCNYVSERTKRSCPLASFERDDLLRLALEMDEWYRDHWAELNNDERDRVDTIIPSSYGTIEEYYDETGKKHLKTTKAQRTGCTVCGFGVHTQVNDRPHRFDILRVENPKAWKMATDPVEEGGWGWGKVLDYFEIPWRDEPKIEEQQNIFGDIDKEMRERTDEQGH